MYPGIVIRVFNPNTLETGTGDYVGGFAFKYIVTKKILTKLMKMWTNQRNM